MRQIKSQHFETSADTDERFLDGHADIRIKNAHMACEVIQKNMAVKKEVGIYISGSKTQHMATGQIGRASCRERV